MPEHNEETTIEDQDQKHLFMLEDVIVDTLGLVGKGAIGQDFFLLKSEDGEPVEQDEIIEELEKLDESEQPPSVLERVGLQRIVQLLKRGQEAETAGESPEGDIAKNLTPAATRAVRSLLRSYGDDLPSEAREMLEMLLEDSGEMMESDAKKGDDDIDKENSEETMPEETTPQVAEEPQAEAAPAIPPDTPTQEQAPDIQAELQKRDEQITALMDRLEKAETVRADLEKAQERVTEVEKAYQAERDARTLMTYIEKAEKEYPALPVKADDLGKFLHWLARQDEAANVEKAADAQDRQDQLGFVTELFKAVNEMAIQSGFFAEAGTAKVPKDASLIEKAQAAVDAGEYETLKDALLKMDQAEAERYLEQYH